jgi:hypothetical protein
MALPLASPERQLKHRRRIDIEIHSRGSGLWEVDARLEDVRTCDIHMADGLRRAGEPLHDMRLRIVVDERFNILEAGAQTDAMPYAGECDGYGDAYARLVGLNLLDGFRGQVRARLGGVLGCTHLTELTWVLPTAVVQAFAGEGLLDRPADAGEPVRPFEIDRCHALRADGAAVQIHYPRWYRAPSSLETRTSETP